VTGTAAFVPQSLAHEIPMQERVGWEVVRQEVGKSVRQEQAMPLYP
jgi:hypothetical protein